MKPLILLGFCNLIQSLHYNWVTLTIWLPDTTFLLI